MAQLLFVFGIATASYAYFGIISKVVVATDFHSR